jgi:hypothetical protein
VWGYEWADLPRQTDSAAVVLYLPARVLVSANNVSLVEKVDLGRAPIFPRALLHDYMVSEVGQLAVAVIIWSKRIRRLGRRESIFLILLPSSRRRLPSPLVLSLAERACELSLS